MKTAIVYHSSHHGNTKKLVDAIVAAHNDIAVFEAESCRPDDLSSFDLIGLASGIYYFSFHKSILDIAAARKTYEDIRYRRKNNFNFYATITRNF